MICSLCNKTALYHEGKTGFCGDHREEAVQAARRGTDSEQWLKSMS